MVLVHYSHGGRRPRRLPSHFFHHMLAAAAAAAAAATALQGPLLAVVRQPKMVFRQRCFSDGARDSEFRQPRKFFRLSRSGEK